MLGSGVGVLYTVPLAWYFIGALAVIVLSASVKLIAGKVWKVAVVLIFSLLVGGVSTHFYLETQLTPKLDKLVQEAKQIEGMVIYDPELRPDSQHLILEVQDGRVLAIIPKDAVVAYQDRVSFRGKLEKPTSFSGEHGRVFDYEGYLQAKGVDYVLFYPELVSVASTSQNPDIFSGLYALKHIFKRQLEAVLHEPHSALATALLLGERRALSEERLDEFRSTGIIHIVVLSGLSVMFVVAFFQYVLGLILPVTPRLITAMVGVVAFACMVGLTPSITRASIMACMYLIAQLTNRMYLALRGLLLAAVGMVALNPYILVYDVGFQLSFLATLGLILVAPYLEQSLIAVPDRIPIRTYLVATLATQIAVLPWLLYQVGELSLVAPLINVLVVPMVPIAMLLAFLTGIVSLVLPSVVNLVAYPTYLALNYILSVSDWFGSWAYASVWVPAFSLWWVGAGYFALFLLYYQWSKPAKTKLKAVPPKQLEPATILPGWRVVGVEKLDKK